MPNTDFGQTRVLTMFTNLFAKLSLGPFRSQVLRVRVGLTTLPGVRRPPRGPKTMLNRGCFIWPETRFFCLEVDLQDLRLTTLRRRF
jgi:hypothetical protein